MRLPTTIPIHDGPVRPWIDRLVAAATLSAAVGAVWFLGRVTPDARGHGTHEQLGMTPCGWAIQGYPCPTCGVTTAACHVVHGQLLRAVWANPFGAALAMAGLAAAVVALICLVRRRSFLDLIARLPYGTVVLGGILLLLASWLFKYLTFVP